MCPMQDSRLNFFALVSYPERWSVKCCRMHGLVRDPAAGICEGRIGTPSSSRYAGVGARHRPRRKGP